MEFEASNSNFTGNQARFLGGSVYLVRSGAVRLQGCRFIGNAAGRAAGAFAAVLSGTLRGNDSLWQGNSAGASVGALACMHCAGLSLEKSSFVDNMAGTEAGAILIQSATGPSSMTDVTIMRNAVTGRQALALGQSPGAATSAPAGPLRPCSSLTTLSNSDMGTAECMQCPPGAGGGLCVYNSSLVLLGGTLSGESLDMPVNAVQVLNSTPQFITPPQLSLLAF